MDLMEGMQQKVFVVVGDTLDEEKYAYKIKTQLNHNGYTVYGVWKEYESIDEIDEEIDIIDLCINPKWGLKYIKECTKKIKCIVIQPGAESPEILQYLKENKIPFLEGCLLVGLSLYAKETKRS